MSGIETIKNKVILPEQLDYYLTYLRFKQFKTVFTNGCFDIIHRGHIEYLVKARALGDLLIIGLNSDISVLKNKGQGRPVQDQQSRAIILASMTFVDAIVLFDEYTPYELIEKIRPDILVKGGDYIPEDIAGYDIVKSYGGTIQTIEYIKGFSTSAIVEKLINL